VQLGDQVPDHFFFCGHRSLLPLALRGGANKMAAVGLLLG